MYPARHLPPVFIFLVSCIAVFKLLAEAGIALHAYDCHGHGRSEPTEERDRALVWKFQHLVCSLSHYCPFNSISWVPHSLGKPQKHPKSVCNAPSGKTSK